LMVLARTGGRLLHEEPNAPPQRTSGKSGSMQRSASDTRVGSAASSSGAARGSRPQSASTTRSSAVGSGSQLRGQANAAVARPASAGQSKATAKQITGVGRSVGRGGKAQAASSGAEPYVENFKGKLDEALAQGLEVDFCEKPYFRTALWEAAWRNQEAIVKILAESGASISKADFQGRTPLHEVAYYGHLELAKLLVEAGHSVNCADKFGQTPLFRAAEGRRHDLVEFLMSQGANPNLIDLHGLTVQHEAAFKGLPTMSTWLFTRGAYKNRFNLHEHTGRCHSTSELALARIRSPSDFVVA